MYSVSIYRDMVKLIYINKYPFYKADARPTLQMIVQATWKSTVEPQPEEDNIQPMNYITELLSLATLSTTNSSIVPLNPHQAQAE
jgi:hypothetical protein